MNHLGLFEGIGGFSLAAQRMGWETKAWCEINPFGQQILKYYFPAAEAFFDIKQSNFEKYKGLIDILTGGFPCQPYSLAGERKGKQDERHLWPEMLRAIKQVQPRWVVGENVLGLVNWNEGLVFHEVQTDLEAAGYEVFSYVLPACAVNAPHRRDRVWFIAHARNNGLYGTKDGQGHTQRNNSNQARAQTVKQLTGCGSTPAGTPIANPYPGGRKGQDSINKKQSKGSGQFFGGNGSQWQDFPTQSPLCGGNDGLPTQLDGITVSKWWNASIKAYGNAIVPQVAYQIFKAIEEYETQGLSATFNNGCGAKAGQW